MGDKSATLYNGEVVVHFTEEDHRYVVSDSRWQGGKPFEPPSVTKILKQAAKPALVQWAANMAVGYIENSWQPGRAYNELEIAEILKAAKFAHKTKADKGKDFGTLGHRYMESYVKSQLEFGLPEPELPNHLEVRSACEQMVGWLGENVEEYVAVEALIYSRKYRIASTLDLMTRFKGGILTLTDYKFASGAWPEYSLQMSAYAVIWQECFGELPAQRYIPLWNKKKLKFEPTPLDQNLLAADFDAFLGFYAAHKRFAKSDEN